jgi:hypothetical protein
MPAWITSLIIQSLPQVLHYLGSLVDQDAMFKALIAGEIAEPGLLGPLKEVLSRKDAIFLNDQLRAAADTALNWLIARFSTHKLAALAVASGLTVDKPLTADGAHAAADAPTA